jgi:hypothetical protein
VTNPPSVTITFEFEASPRVRCSYRNDATQESRMLDWLEQHTAWLALIGEAIELSKQARERAT